MIDIKQFIESHIPQMDSPEKVYQLFQGLGYKTLDPSYKGKEAWGLREKDKEFIKRIYAIADYKKKFQIFLVELKTLSPGIIREIPLYFEREIQYPFFIFTPDYQNYTFVLIEKIREDVGVWKRKIIKLNLDRENAYYTDKLVISNMAVVEGMDEPSFIYKTLKEALSVEKVSKIFFEDYKTIFFKIRNFLLKQNINIKQAHEFSQTLLNRIMFIYFIDKKRWLKHSPKFMKWFWNKYLEEKKKNNIKDQFYEKWLKILFLEAFNNRFSHPHYLPQDVREALALVPYLNGGLFKKTELDELFVNISDKLIEDILNFFEKYNFTIREDLPLDVEVAVDPQMIGYVYESLANVAEEIYERQDLGIFYTPKVEVDFMCRRSLLEYLAKTTDIPREKLYQLLFDEDKRKIEKSLQLSDYEKLEESLDNLSVLDPACGSGAFLVGMLNVLVELYKIIFKHLNREMTGYQLKKRIIGNCLYGVDVMPWAVHSAELRLWLSLMIESDLSLGELKLYPLLPNLNLKLRVGDSLIQEIGGISLNLRDIFISPSLKRKLSEIKREKEKFYNNDPTGKFKTEKAILQEELRIFYEILDERIISLQKKKQLLSIKSQKQVRLFEDKISQKKLFDEKKLKEMAEKEKKKIDEEINRLIEIKRKLKEQKPFIWDIDFAEIFGEKGGFDIVIGNPPYVRQEKIAPPNRLRNEITNEDKKEYKEKLLKSIKTQFPFIKIIDKKSDYYVYFYFYGLSLLNNKGTFCFITSNSWLDVSYGKNLQEFLLKYIPIIAIYDNQAKRSFEHADVNTIIALFGAPCKSKKAYPALQNIAKFIMFKRPFEEVINTKNLFQIEQAATVISTEDFRIYPKKQEDLLEEGWEYPEEKQQRITKEKFSYGKYTGNKWGGKYLRAPDIYFTILEKGKGKLVRLGDIAEVRRGFTTGANEFFYLPSKHFDIKKEGRFYRLIPKHEGLPEDLRIEEEFLRPMLFSIKDTDSIKIDIKNLKKFIFWCHLSKGELKAQKCKALRYIEWGEELKTSNGKRLPEVPSVKGRKYWYWLPKETKPDVISNRFIGERFMFLEGGNFKVCDVFFIATLSNFDREIVLSLINSTITYLILEVLGRKTYGIGVMYIYGPEITGLVLPDPTKFIKEKSKLKKVYQELRSRKIHTIYEELGINPNLPIRNQNPNPLPDRKALDDIVFDILGLTEDERREVYWAVCELVKNRLEKARSV